MRMSGERGFRALRGVVFGLATGLLAGCAAINGAPRNPGNSSSDLAVFREGFDQSLLREYFDSAEPRTTTLRNQIVAERMQAYRVAYENFKSDLRSHRTMLSLGSDLAVLGLTAAGGFGVSAGTTAGLLATAGLVTGANGVISKDVYYDQTINVLITQMDANVATATVPILNGLAQPNVRYNLITALSDLDKYRNAGTINSAISGVARNANVQQATAEFELDTARDFNSACTTTCQKVVAFLYPNGDESRDYVASQFARLRNVTAPLLDSVPLYNFIHSPDQEANRARALARL